MKKLILLSLFLTLQILFAQYSNAQQLEDREQQAKTKAEEVKAQKCTQLTTRIDLRIASFNANANGKETVYTNLANKISETISKLESKGYDVSKLKTDLVTLNEKIKKYWSDRQAVVDKLEESKNYACGTTDGQFKETIKQTKELFKVVQANIMEIRLFVNTTIRPDIQALKSQKVTETP